MIPLTSDTCVHSRWIHSYDQSLLLLSATEEDFISTDLSCSPPDHIDDRGGSIAADLRLESLDCWSSLLHPTGSACCGWVPPTIEGLSDRWSGLCDPPRDDTPRPPPLRPPPLFRSASMMPLAGMAEYIA